MTTPTGQRPRIGSLFSGYGGLDMGVIAALGSGSVAWHVEFDDAPSRILAHHWPDVPNYGDITLVDWSKVERVQVLTGGFPCQDVSLAGARAGLKTGTRSGLWSYFAAAINALRPELVVIENVRGLLSATAGDTQEWSDEEISDLESAQGSLGEPRGGDRPVLRAIGAVLGDLAELGYDAEWCGVRASDAGAPHGRFRVFILAHPRVRYTGHDARGTEQGQQPESAGGRAGQPGTVSDADTDGVGWGEGRTESEGRIGRLTSLIGGSTPNAASEPGRIGHGDDVRARRGAFGCEPDARRSAAQDTDLAVGGERGQSAPGQTQRGWTWADVGGRGRASAADTDRAGRCEHGGTITVQPEYEATEHGSADTPADADNAPGDGERARAGSSNRGADASADAGGERLGEHARESSAEEARSASGDIVDGDGGLRPDTDWGPYRPAIERWERVLGRFAPAPTEQSAKGSQRLSPRFVEWMMGLPSGHVTAPEIGLTRNQQLKALGNGVVRQQAALAVGYLLRNLELGVAA